MSGRLLQTFGFIAHVIQSASLVSPKILGKAIETFTKHDGVWKNSKGREFHSIFDEEDETNRGTVQDSIGFFQQDDLDLHPQLLNCDESEGCIRVFDFDPNDVVCMSEENVATIPGSVRKKLLETLPDFSDLGYAASTFNYPLATIQEGTVSDLQGDSDDEELRLGTEASKRSGKPLIDDRADESTEAEDPNDSPPNTDSEEEGVRVPDNEYQPSEEDQRDIKKVHDNSGHPRTDDFVRLLRRGGARSEVVSWVKKHFRCEQCEAHKLPKIRRPTAIPKSYRFNYVVGVDLVEVKFKGEPHWWINAICWGTNFQQVMLIPKPGSKEPENAWDAFNESWVRIFGCPEIIVCDPGSEFRHLFCEKAAGEGGIVLPTDARAPWQNGKTERAGKE